MIFIDIEMPNRCADCPCFKITRSDGEIYGSDSCQLMHLIFNEDVYYGKHIHNPFESRYEDCPLKNASDFLKTTADRPRGEWIPCSEKMPNDDEWAIWCSSDGVIGIARFKEDCYNHFYPNETSFDLEDAVAWMPLPEPFCSVDMRGEDE